MVAELSRALVDRRRRNLVAGIPEHDPGALYGRWRAEVEQVMRHSWREAVAQDNAILMWLEELKLQVT